MTNNEFIEGVNIIARNIPKEEREGFSVRAEHDQLWFGDEEWVTDKKDIARLEELGWFKEYESWSCFT